MYKCKICNETFKDPTIVQTYDNKEDFYFDGTYHMDDTCPNCGSRHLAEIED